MAEEKSAQVVWQGTEQKFKATVASGYSFNMHAPAGPEGASPMDYLLAGVAGCTAIDVLSILQKMRQDIQGLEVKIRGKRAETPPSVYTDVAVTYIITGHAINPAAVERAIELSETKYCSASAMFQRSGTNMTSEYLIQEAEPAD